VYPLGMGFGVRRMLAAGAAVGALVVAVNAASLGFTGPRFSASASAPPTSGTMPSSRADAVDSPVGRVAGDGPGVTVTMVGAGDIASCGATADSKTAKLIESIPGAIVFTAGDDAYQSGSAEQFRQCYGPTWGAFRARTHPVIGNHDMMTSGGAAYFAYFGASAGTPGEGWYSFQAGTWHVVVLNGNCTIVGCGLASPQLTWLQNDLAAHPGGCTLAIWHQPRFTSGVHGSDTRLVPFWEALYQAGAEIVVNGHDHDYERFGLQTPFGVADRAGGIREFVAGTGGRKLRRFPRRPIANSKARNSWTYGVLKLVLAPGSYSWQFMGVPGSTFSDAGHGVCH